MLRRARYTLKSSPLNGCSKRRLNTIWKTSPPEAVLDALADHRLVFLAGDRGGLGTRCLEVVGGEVTVLDQRKDLFQPAILAVLNHLHQSKLILEMIEDKDILI